MSDDKDHLNVKPELRERILDAAVKLFMAEGIKCIKMDDIASAVGISKRTLYEVFDDKETLLCECIKKQHKNKTEFFEGILKSSKHVLEVILIAFERSIENLQNTNAAFFTDIVKYEKAYDMVKKERMKHVASTVEFMQKGVAQGIFRSDVNFEIINMLLDNQLHMLINEKIYSEFPLIAVYESIIVTTLRGISTTKGAEELEKFIVEYRKNKQQ